MLKSLLRKFKIQDDAKAEAEVVNEAERIPEVDFETPAPAAGINEMVDEKYKLELARTLADTFIEQDDRAVYLILERMVDTRICSFISYYLARALFDVGGDSVVERCPDLLDLLKLNVSVNSGHNVIDHSFESGLLMPVKYRGYGHPVNYNGHVGHLFKINMLSFPNDSRIIGYRDRGDDEAIVTPLKGMRPVKGSHGWRLYELDPALSDDMTAIFTVNSLAGERLVEICHYLGDDRHCPIIYRFSKTN